MTLEFESPSPAKALESTVDARAIPLAQFQSIVDGKVAQAVSAPLEAWLCRTCALVVFRLGVRPRHSAGE